jgi:hypothetical protein
MVIIAIVVFNIVIVIGAIALVINIAVVGTTIKLTTIIIAVFHCNIIGLCMFFLHSSQGPHLDEGDL